MSEEPSYTPREEFQCDNSQIHYQGCKCHEARWRRTMDVVVAERDAAVATVKRLQEAYLPGNWERLQEIVKERDAALAQAAGYRAALEWYADITNYGEHVIEGKRGPIRATAVDYDSGDRARQALSTQSQAQACHEDKVDRE
jgi:hypothetical protein